MTTTLDRLLSHPVYTPAELRAELVLYRELADKHGATSREAHAVRNRIVARHLKALAGDARKYRVSGMDLEDWIAHGVLGLITAVEHFDASKGYSFSTYSRHWIRSELQNAYHMQTAAIRVPRSARRAARRGCEKNAARIEQVSRVLSMDAPMLDGSIRRDHVAGRLPMPDNDVEDDREHRRMRYAMAKLETRERVILRARAEGHGLCEVGEALGVSRERVRQVEGTALHRLRFAMGVDADGSVGDVEGKTGT